MELKKKPLCFEPIAHEVVFCDQKFKRNIQNSFRFVVLSYMYHKGLYLRDVLATRKDLRYETVRSNLFLHSSNTKTISSSLATEFCKILEVNLEFLYHIAKEFKDSLTYNSISFGEKSVTFFRGEFIKFGF